MNVIGAVFQFVLNVIIDVFLFVFTGWFSFFVGTRESSLKAIPIGICLFFVIFGPIWISGDLTKEATKVKTEIAVNKSA